MHPDASDPGSIEAPLPVRPRRVPAPRVLTDLLAPTGVRIDGSAPWDIQVHDPSVYARVLRDGSLGLGEAYMAGAWDSARLDETFTRLLACDLDQRIHGIARGRFALLWLWQTLVNRQSRRRAFQVGAHHYDIGNEVYAAMLDPGMNYSCGYWAQADDLTRAQEAKLALTCAKLALQPGQRVLEIGCGWGGFADYAARRHGVAVTAITVSREQQRLAAERCAALPVEVRLCDYRDLRQAPAGAYDRIVSIGMFEHVGPRNYAEFFAIAHRLLAADGLFLLHTIGNINSVQVSDPWIDRYIFPNGKAPAAAQIARAIEPWFIFEDWHNFGLDYDRTLMAWWANFDAAWPRLQGRYTEVFYRMWKYYLHSCAGYFRSRQGQLWQLVLAKRSRCQRYQGVR